MNKKEIIEMWQQGEQFDGDGYKDLAFTLKENALEELRKLPKQEKLQVVDIIMPLNKNDGN